MNLIVDEMIPYLISSGIKYDISNPSQTLSVNVDNANFGNYNLYLSLKNSSSLYPLLKTNNNKRINVFHFKDSFDGQRCANTIANNIKDIYFSPEDVIVIGTLDIREINFSIMVSVLVDFGNHNDLVQTKWIRQNIEKTARNLAISLTQYFDVPFIEPTPIKIGISNSRFSLIDKPSVYSKIIATIPPKVTVDVLG